MLGNELKNLVPRDQRRVKIDDALNNMRIRNRQIQSTSREIAAKIAGSNPMTNIGLVDSQASNKVCNCDGLVPTGCSARKFGDDERRDDEKVSGNCHIKGTNAAAIDVIDEN
jgi:hypothetical protein